MYGRPPTVRVEMSNCPIVTVERYAAIGSVASQRQIERAPRRSTPLRIPLAIASSPARHGDPERVARLVARMLVGRVPGRCAVRLARDQRAVVGRHPAVLVAERALPDRARLAVVGDDGDERPAAAQARARDDRQLAALAPPRRRARADLDRPHRQAMEVEVEARQVLRRLGRDRRDALQHARLGRVGDVQAVVGDVVAAVAVLREVRVADPGRAGPGRGLRGRRQGEHEAKNEQRALHAADRIAEVAPQPTS